MKFGKKPCKVSFLQALGLLLYVCLISIVFWKGNQWFPKMHPYVGPILMLTLFAVSALISAIITLGYPFILWQKHKKTKEAVRIVIYTALWVVGFLVLGFLVLGVLK